MCRYMHSLRRHGSAMVRWRYTCVVNIYVFMLVRTWSPWPDFFAVTCWSCRFLLLHCFCFSSLVPFDSNTKSAKVVCKRFCMFPARCNKSNCSCKRFWVVSWMAWVRTCSLRMACKRSTFASVVTTPELSSSAMF